MNMDDVTTGKGAEMKMDCPVCGGKNTATYTTQTHELAYFGEIVESTIQCERCGFRHNDIITTEQKDPAKHSLIISKKNLDSRVVRSQSATVSLPEIGIKVDFSIVNLCGADIGMISTISPYTDEQVDIGYLADGTVLKITMDWPEEVNIFDLAVYNVNGELVSTSEVDITGVTESVIITLSGEGDLEDVKAEVK